MSTVSSADRHLIIMNAGLHRFSRRISKLIEHMLFAIIFPIVPDGPICCSVCCRMALNSSADSVINTSGFDSAFGTRRPAS
jgi:hypothetical protein